MTVRKLVYGLVFAGCVLYAQSQPPAAGTASAPAAPQMHLNVVALDSHNDPVGDLKADELQVTDQGKPQRITSFQHIAADMPPAPNEFSNRPVVGGGRHTVVMFDLFNQARENGLDAAHRLGHALAQLPSGDSLYFYILGLDGNLYPIHPFPEPGPVPASDRTWNQQADQQIQATLNKVNRARKAGMTNEDVAKKTYVALETLAKDLTGFRGERNIVWVTDGVPELFSEKDSERGCPGDWFGDCAIYLPHLSVRLAATNTTVYPLTYTRSADANTARDMDYFAASTGGRSLAGIDIGEVLNQISSDSKNTYVLTYQPSSDNWDSKFHKVKINCDRKGLKIQARNRYYAVPAAAGGAEPNAASAAVAPAKDEDTAIIAALENTADIPNIGINVSVSPAAGGKKAVHFQIRLNVADIQMTQQGGTFNDQIAVMFADYTASGLKGIPMPSDFDLRMTPEQHDKMLKEGLTFGVDHAVDSTIQNVRFVVFDHANNAYGTLSIPLPAMQASPAPAAPAAH